MNASASDHVSRTERLPQGWKWHDNLSVINGEGQIVYLTTGLRDEENIKRAITKVMENRGAAALRQKALA